VKRLLVEQLKQVLLDLRPWLVEVNGETESVLAIRCHFPSLEGLDRAHPSLGFQTCLRGKLTHPPHLVHDAFAGAAPFFGSDDRLRD
jgi:hypothetical protein